MLKIELGGTTLGTQYDILAIAPPLDGSRAGRTCTAEADAHPGHADAAQRQQRHVPANTPHGNRHLVQKITGTVLTSDSKPAVGVRVTVLGLERQQANGFAFGVS
jgi:hypothetical protein